MCLFQEAQCYRTSLQMRRAGTSKNFPCDTIAKYESSKYLCMLLMMKETLAVLCLFYVGNFIVWKGLRLTTTDPSVGKLSKIKTKYLDSIKEEIGKMFYFSFPRRRCIIRKILVFCMKTKLKTLIYRNPFSR